MKSLVRAATWADSVLQAAICCLKPNLGIHPSPAPQSLITIADEGLETGLLQESAGKNQLILILNEV